MMRENRIVNKLSAWYFSKKVLPYWAILLMDALIMFVSVVFTYWVANRSAMTFEHRTQLFYTAVMFAVLGLVGARMFRTYAGVLRYSGTVDLIKLAYANCVTYVLAMCASLAAEYFGVEELCALSPKAVFMAVMVATLLMWASRLAVKTLYESVSVAPRAKRVLIFGTMSGGVGLAKYIRTQRPAKFELSGFISHDIKFKNKKMLGVKVYTLEEDLAAVVKKEKIGAILVSPLRVDDFRSNQKLQDELIGAGVKIYIAKEVQEAPVENGELVPDTMQLKEVSVEDLLPRQQIRVSLKEVERMLTGRRVLITGAAGSIGMEIVRQVAQFKPGKMILIDQAETPQHDVLLMMNRDFPEVDCDVVVTSISRVNRMEHIFSAFRPEYVFHAAAYKHVPMMEMNPSEAVLNNIYGTKVIADMSVKYGVKKFVMVSTDKAVNPTNVMGCSKRICEIYVQSLDRKFKKDAMMGTEKGFGNVLGSNGSVIPLFKEQIKNGGPVTVTDERIVRFFMLIPEACKLVLEAGTMGNGGEIFVFDMGQPVRIADLAKRMIALSGAKGVEIKYTGLREGEKLYEEVLNELEGTKPTFHEKIRIAEVREYDYDQVSADIDELVELAKEYDNMATVRKMKQIVPEYKSNNSVYEVLDKEA